MESNGSSTSLRERWKDHYHKKRDFIKVKPVMANRVSLLVMACFTFAITIQLLFIIIPGLEPGPANFNTRIMWTVCVCLLVAEMTANWFLTWYDVRSFVHESTKERISLGSLDRLNDWRSCVACRVDAPPRSYHCKLCQRCVLKRDHHCFFTGSCVGYFNQRRYVVFCFYMCLASIAALWLLLHYCNQVIPIASKHFVVYVAPVTIWKWCTGNLSTALFAVLCNSYVTLLSAISSGFFLLWEITLVIRGQTSHEAWRNINTYRDDHVLNNIRLVFGSNWLLQFVLPLRTPLPGDGCGWEKAKRLKFK